MKDQKIYVLLFSLLFVPLVWGAGSSASHWTFDPAEYAYDMNVHAALTFNGMDVEDYATFEVALFVEMNAVESLKLLYHRARSIMNFGCIARSLKVII